MNTLLEISQNDLIIAPYYKRFKKKKQTRFRKIAILKTSFREFDFNSSYNYIYENKLCYLKFIETSLPLNYTKYEVREIIDES